jgi:hypothetical protein
MNAAAQDGGTGDGAAPSAAAYPRLTPIMERLQLEADEVGL